MLANCPLTLLDVQPFLQGLKGWLPYLAVQEFVESLWAGESPAIGLVCLLLAVECAELSVFHGKHIKKDFSSFSERKGGKMSSVCSQNLLHVPNL